MVEENFASAESIFLGFNRDATMSLYYMTELVFKSVCQITHADWLLRGPEKAY